MRCACAVCLGAHGMYTSHADRRHAERVVAVAASNSQRERACLVQSRLVHDQRARDASLASRDWALADVDRRITQVIATIENAITTDAQKGGDS